MDATYLVTFTNGIADQAAHTVGEAEQIIMTMMAWDAVHLSDWYPTQVPGGDIETHTEARFAYETEAEMEADEEGSDAPSIIELPPTQQEN